MEDSKTLPALQNSHTHAKVFFFSKFIDNLGTRPLKKFTTPVVGHDDKQEKWRYSSTYSKLRQ